MSRTQSRLIVAGLVLGLFFWVFADAIFRDRNFCYRDAGHFYYPLLKLVQDEWEAGRWPLWNPYENGGMPLLGNPTSAVLYPPRIAIFQWLPLSYATAYKWYTLLHVLMCAATAYSMARNWNASEFAAGLAAISYAFGAVVMFQYCNVIFLVGAAWLPFGLLAIDRMLRAGSWRWAIVLGLILAMQVLGGDAEAAYVTGGLAALFLILIDGQFGISLAGTLASVYLIKRILGNDVSRSFSDHALALFAVLTVLLTPVVLWWLRRRRRTANCATNGYSTFTIALWRLRRRRRSAAPGADELRLERQRRLCLVVAAAVAIGVSAVQWIPAWEFNRISLRAAGGIHHEPYAFWIGPWRVIEMLWPNVAGHQFPINTRWLDIVHVGDRTWEPSLYFGALVLALSVSAWRIRDVSAWQRWISLTLVLSLWAATGPGGGVSWYVKMVQRVRASPADNLSAILSDLAHGDSSQERDGPPTELETPSGGLYWLMVQVLPGFGSFRYPAKLMTFAAAAFSALAALGWDRMFSHDRPRNGRLIAVAAVTSVTLALAGLAARSHLTDWFGDSWLAKGSAYYGPLQADAAAWCIVRALATTAVGLLLVFGVYRFSLSRVNAEVVAAIVLLIVAVDIGLANRWMVSTAAQQKFDAVPKVTEIIEAAEAAESPAGPRQPFRIHRVSIWSPPRWFQRVSTDQDEEVFRWEKDTIQPKYGLLKFGDAGRFSYTINEGALEPYDYWWFFSPFYSNTTPVKRSIVCYPMRGYDMWGAKYFVLPMGASDSDQHRGVRSFMIQSTPIAESPMDKEDFQVWRNDHYFPRAWIVHRVIYRPPIEGMAKADRMTRMLEILYPGYAATGFLWHEADWESRVQNPREVAWLEHPDPAYVASLQTSASDPDSDRCQIVSYEPDRVEIDVETSARGVMVLADLFFTGWKVTVDDKPIEILRANRIMRGVPLSPGKHRVVFVYNPLSFRAGGLVTLLSIAATVAALAFSWLRSRWLPSQVTSSLDTGTPRREPED